MRRGYWALGFFGAVTLLAPDGSASDGKGPVTIEAIKQAIEAKAESVQLVTFPATEWSPVKVVRGSEPARDNRDKKPADERADTAEIVSFSDPQRTPVRILRGERATPGRSRPAAMTTEVVTFANLQDRPVSIVRGSGFQPGTDMELFGPASAADIDRVAFAVDGAESSHGADLRMWRPEPFGPQGPMQITAAAAFDVGGGDRFDLAANRALGRAYLDRMYRRYGNWPDAVAAYNWGPGNLDAWIGSGRAADKLPLTVERYRNRVLRDAAMFR